MGFFRAESGGNKPSTVNNRNHILDVEPLTDTEKQKWTQYRSHYRLNNNDEWAKDMIAASAMSLDDVFHAAIKKLTTIEKEFRESLDSGDVKLTAKGERDYLALKKDWMNEGAPPSVDWMYFHGNLGVINQETGEVNTTIATSTRKQPAVTPTKPVEEPPKSVADTQTAGILDTIASFFGNGVPEDPPLPEERTL